MTNDGEIGSSSRLAGSDTRGQNRDAAALAGKAAATILKPVAHVNPTKTLQKENSTHLVIECVKHQGHTHKVIGWVSHQIIPEVPQ